MGKPELRCLPFLVHHMANVFNYICFGIEETECNLRSNVCSRIRVWRTAGGKRQLCSLTFTQKHTPLNPVPGIFWMKWQIWAHEPESCRKLGYAGNAFVSLRQAHAYRQNFISYIKRGIFSEQHRGASLEWRWNTLMHCLIFLRKGPQFFLGDRVLPDLFLLAAWGYEDVCSLLPALSAGQGALWAGCTHVAGPVQFICGLKHGWGGCLARSCPQEPSCWHGEGLCLGSGEHLPFFAGWGPHLGTKCNETLQKHCLRACIYTVPVPVTVPNSSKITVVNSTASNH